MYFKDSIFDLEFPVLTPAEMIAIEFATAFHSLQRTKEALRRKTENFQNMRDNLAVGIYVYPPAKPFADRS